MLDVVSGMSSEIEIYAHLYIFLVFILTTVSTDVYILTDANFTDKIKNYEVALIKFFVPW